MKTFLTLCFVFTFSCSQVWGQCQILNGDFEEWEDQTAQFETELGIMLVEEVMVPKGYFSLLRLVQLALGDIILPFFDTGVADRALFSSVQRAEPGAEGSQYALRISGDTLLEVTDLLSSYPCGERPTSLKGYYRYSGTSDDSLLVAALFSQGEAAIDEEQAIGVASMFAGAGSSQFTEFEVPITYSSPATPDSVTILIIATKEEGSKENSFFEVDELSFIGATTSTADVALEVQDLITPNPVSDHIQVSNAQKLSSLEILNLDGQVLTHWSNVLPEHQVEHLPPGIYVARATSDQEVVVQKFVRR
ncbi:MAG: T9SS type A sorting domain-containing protein [Saprospiraceae bacterium]|nr:T9SS type A sorting domain-containing protein [Saprospiraceae bacterium]